MKKLVTSYTFDASLKTIDSADFTSLEKIQLVTNVTDGIIIYNFADSAKNGTLSGTTLTLDYDTTSMDDTDKLQIFVEDGTVVQPVSATSLPLPTGAATSAKQDTGNTSLASIDGKITAVNTGAVVIASGNVTADTELPAAAVLADNASNPTAPAIASFGMLFDGSTWDRARSVAALGDGGTAALATGGYVFNGTTWDRAKGDATDGTLVNLGGNNDVTVSGTVTANLAAGTNNIGDIDVLSIAAGDNNIGNVDIVTVPAPLSTTGGGTEATALRVTIANDSTGVVSIDDNGGSLTVDNGGTFAVQGTAVGTIADDATTPGAPVMIGGSAVETDGTDPGSVSAEDDVARLRTDRNRRVLVNKSHPNAWKLFEDHTSAQTNNQLKSAPGANLSLYITDIIYSNGATAGSIKLVEDEGGTPVQLTQTVYMAINGGAVMNFETPIRMTANKTLGFTSVTCTTHSVEVHGYIAP